VRRLPFRSSAVGSQLIQPGSFSEIGDSQRGREAVNTEVLRRWKPLPDNDW
jgi:hypothetical protein